MAYREKLASEGAAWRPRSEAQTCHRRWRIVDNSMQAKAKPEAQLGARRSQSHEPRFGWWRTTHRWGLMWHETNKKPLRWGCEG